MDDRLSIDTPEQIDLNYNLAGIGSRFCASFVDTLLIGLFVALGWLVIFQTLSLDNFAKIISNWMAAIVGIITFTILWGYYIIFDLVKNGQSPGKRLLKLRVIKENGYPISFADSAIRNLVRIVDFLPAFYGVGMVVMMFDKKWRRLGDFAAGTLVIREHIDLNPNQLIAHVTTRNHFTYANAIQLDGVTDVELSTIREYLSRRSALLTRRRRQLAYTIGMPIAQKMGITGPIDYDVFLEEIFALITSPEHSR
ncbi:RDD family protein [Candidatus Poribacteria bacterium]|nr:RDD family protein [Candidatus Poribacteria bacterium]